MVKESAKEYPQPLDTYSVKDILTLMNEEDKKVAHAVEKALPHIEMAVKSIVESMEKGGRLFYIGAGTSGRLGVLDASECPPTFGVDEELVTGIIAGGELAIRYPIENAEDDFQEGKRAIASRVGEKDVVVGIAASGTTPYVLGAMEKAAEIGAATIGISCLSNTKLSSMVQFPIEVNSGQEIVLGSSRLKAGTAQKMVLNMLSTAAMIKLGKVYNNLMVNVQSTNHKLRIRVFTIVKEITGADDSIVREAIEQAKGDARAAILMITYGINQKRAANALAENNGHFRKAMEWCVDNKEIHQAKE
ncbi:N-acetylmuramic acid 6-phosphate etherase [Falsibacillus pallidus]|uniref:N-acetylmuramic acid 6-phosphate etherase n=1 Tax=Falsibacillus pallidus TaxID=493781 RepID=A0A370FYB2_9BACI|nr:N-acetylmuramic acid 6-phosphate etherase [Falsibacillus pallidus]RDI36468.1 N-acetylmuramic acid 6-phosphate etherase [Falsibacillus pallidus]